MKIYKLLFLTLLSCFALSCSQDNVEDYSIDNSNDRLAAGQFDNSYLGVYKGLFTTNDGLSRGSIVVTLSPDNTALAQLTLSSGEVVELRSSSVKLTVDNTVSNLHFSSVGLSARNVSLNFSVEGNGSNPLVSNVSFENTESDIFIAKNLSRVPLTPITGTYECTNCAELGQGFPSDRTWNVMSIGMGNNQQFAVQVSFGGRIYTSVAANNSQNGCVNIAGYTACGVAGTIQLLGGVQVSWNGTHVYDASDSMACSQVTGSWSAPDFGGGLMGTFDSDSDCSVSVPVPMQLACSEVLVDNGGDGDYADDSFDSYVIDAGAGNVVSLPFTVFNLESTFDFVRIYDGVNSSAPEITEVNGRVIADFGEFEGYDYSGFTGTGSGPYSLEGQTVVSSGRYLYVEFVSDGSVIAPGFNAVVGCVSGRLAANGNISTSETFRPAPSTRVITK